MEYMHVVIVCQPGGWSTCGYCVSARWLEYMWLLCVSQVAGVHVVIVCQPGGWSTCCYCVSARWLELQGGWLAAVCIFPMLMGGRLFLKDDFHTDES